MHSHDEAKRILEAALLASQEPVQPQELKRLFDQELNVETLRKLLDELRDEWKGRSVELVSLASGWRFQTRAEFAPYLALGKWVGVGRQTVWGKGEIETHLPAS